VYRSIRPIIIATASSFVVGRAVLAQPLEREVVECRGQRVNDILIIARPPFPPTSSALFSMAARAASKLHENTRPSVVRRYLALHLGHPCTELRRTESERILRAQPFISDATVVAYSDGPDGVVIEVTVVDEVSLILDGAVSGNPPHLRSVRVGEANLFGAGVYTAIRWREGLGFRDEYAFRFAHYQLFGRPYQFIAQGARRTIGHDWSLEASHPYLTELQRIAWRTNYAMSDGYSRFLRNADTSASLALKRTSADIGGVVRLGVPGFVTLIGGSFSHEHNHPGQSPVVIGAGTVRPDTSSVLFNRYREHRQTRANLLFGFRNLRFMQVTGFDALDGLQDVRKGVQFSALAGKGLRLLDSRTDRGFFGSLALYAGMGSPHSFGAFDASIEGGRDEGESRWNGVLSSARFALYLHPLPRHTLISSTEWSAGWRSRMPFQLSFADKDGGLRGFKESHLAGGRRLVTRLEDRYVWGRFRTYATIGLAAFADAGKLWAGDVPFGVNSPISYSAGVSILASIPPRSQRLLRVDFAYPLSHDVARTWGVRLTVRDATRLFWREPRDVQRVRERSVPSNVFNWP
jgi:hypothetical protein